MQAQLVIEALENEDARRLAAARPFPVDIFLHIEPILEGLDTPGRLMVVDVLAEVSRTATEETGAMPAGVSALLTMTGDPDERVANDAANALLELAKVARRPASHVVHTAAVRLFASVRIKLYRLVGIWGDASVLAELRKLYDLEQDPVARRKLEVAASRLGGVDEQRSFLNRVSQAKAREALAIYGDVVDARDFGALRCMLPWLDNNTVVDVVGTHSTQFSVRMCDLAVLAADRLGVQLGQASPLPYRPVTDETLAVARKAIEMLTPTSAVSEEPLRQPPPQSISVPIPVPVPVPVTAVAQAPLIYHAAQPAKEEHTIEVTPEVLQALKPAISVFGLPLATVTPARASTTESRPAQEPVKPVSPELAGQSKTMLAPPNIDLDAVTPFARPASQTRPSGVPPSPRATPEQADPRRGRSEAEPSSQQQRITYDQYAWACAWITLRPETQSQTLQQLGITNQEAWTAIQTAWQSWLGADRERWNQWCQKLEAMKKHLMRSSQQM